MKSIYVVFEDEEMEDLKRIKEKKSWHDFILELRERERDEDVDARSNNVM